ncbi:gamma-glutamyl-gamma-aminobutyrate hydrolase family protein [Acetobacterium paludosum]|uniref:Gamma-glutamyl-gamma-aminobutyrate hydrolase family protein n=1 Tax=Acetobacterium paludosum TaxID=52693 RepID=A0A923HTI9_9FIRM|nr:gamma-glutamyl-gamma-aminobutyrate hydrolase family protein [Acetobacterium paludosum]MBC3888368.1 gamma-glutamyl-gamma-aminobutyrate hydrolase family protein [Acetobacterium paludosum]
MNQYKKPLIGVLPLYDSNKKCIWMYPGYTDGITTAGGIPVILSLLKTQDDIEEIADRLDGFLFSGGKDIDPQYYGEPVLEYCNEINPPLDSLEMKLLNAVIAKNKPIFGICRGLQLINVFFGGSLYQDINIQMDREQPILHEQENNFEYPVHDISILKNTRLNDIICAERIRVNSMHHQGISILSPRVLATAYSDDGLIEAIEIPEIDFGIAVQWHPEFLWREDENTLNLFKAFIDASR